MTKLEADEDPDLTEAQKADCAAWEQEERVIWLTRAEAAIPIDVPDLLTEIEAPAREYLPQDLGDLEVKVYGSSEFQPRRVAQMPMDEDDEKTEDVGIGRSREATRQETSTGLSLPEDTAAQYHAKLVAEAPTVPQEADLPGTSLAGSAKKDIRLEAPEAPPMPFGMSVIQSIAERTRGDKLDQLIKEAFEYSSERDKKIAEYAQKHRERALQARHQRTIAESTLMQRKWSVERAVVKVKPAPEPAKAKEETPQTTTPAKRVVAGLGRARLRCPR